MHNNAANTKPLTALEFYVLLALIDGQLHGYTVTGSVYGASLGAVRLRDGTLYPLLARLIHIGLIETEDISPAGPSGKRRLHYAISPSGNIRLQEDCRRLKYAVGLATTKGLFNNPFPPDIQSLLAEAENASL